MFWEQFFFERNSLFCVVEKKKAFSVNLIKKITFWRSLPNHDTDHYAIVHSRPGSRHSGVANGGHRSLRGNHWIYCTQKKKLTPTHDSTQHHMHTTILSVNKSQSKVKPKRTHAHTYNEKELFLTKMWVEAITRNENRTVNRN